MKPQSASRHGALARALTFTLTSLLSVAACSNAREGEASASQASSDAAPARTSAAGASSASSAPSAAPVPAEPPSPVDLTAKTWSHAGTTMPLATLDLSKKCLLKGVSIVAPEKVKITPLMGSRGCVLRPWGEDDPYIFIVNDELNMKLAPREELTGVKRLVEEAGDAWLIESTDPKTGFAGRVTRKLGDRVVWCNANSNGKPDGEVITRGLVKLCSTISFAAPSK